MRKTLTAILCLSFMAVAQPNPVGDWRGSGGYVHNVPVSQGHFQLKVTDSQGKVTSYSANWEKPGESFSWQDAQKARHVVTFEPQHRPPRYRDVGADYPDSPGYWYPAK
ncbi:hypothetical protein JST97_15630 [bacterium]|nr:hypothetical protein [bacterium]